MNRRSTIIAYLLWFFLGILGIHRFYLGHWVWGLAYLFTGAFGGIGWVIDLFLIPGYVRDYNSAGNRAVREANRLYSEARLAKRSRRR